VTIDRKAGLASRSFVLTAVLLILSPLAGRLAGSSPQAPSTVMQVRSASIVLRGKPRGGEITVWVKGRELKVSSARPDSIPRLAEKLATAINSDSELRTYGVSARAAEAEVEVTVSEYWLFLCSTDRGLALPPTPSQLRATTRAGHLVDLTWQVPKGGYDSVHVLRGTLPVGDEMAGTATQFTDYLSTEDSYTYYVFGIKDKTPSCAASTVVSIHP